MSKFEVVVDEAVATYITNFDHGTPVALEDLEPHIDSASIIWVQFRLPPGQWLPLSWFKKSAVDTIVSCACEYLSDELGEGKCTISVDGDDYSVDVTDQRVTYTDQNGDKLAAEFRFIILELREFRALRRASRVLILYHQTSFAAAAEILKTQTMLRGRSGMAGGGIYFAVNPSDTDHKAQQHGVVLKAHVHVGHMKTIDVNGDKSLTGEKLALENVDSVCIPRVNGLEVVVYFSDQVHSISEVTRYAADYAVQDVVVLPPRISFAPPIPAEGTRKKHVPLNAWNAFQQANAGKGWTQNDMRAEYKKYKVGGEAGIVNAWNAFEHANAGRGWTKEAMRAAYKEHREKMPTAVTLVSSTASPSGVPQSVNSWNAFQHDHAGRGWDKERMLMEYEAHKARQTAAPRIIVGHPQSVATTQAVPAQVHKPAPASTPSSSTAAPVNSWNAFQHDHAGRGWDKDRMLTEYEAHKARQAAAAAPRITVAPAETVLVRVQRPPSAPSSSTATPANSWNTFQHDHAGRGWSKERMLTEYEAHKARRVTAAAPRIAVGYPSSQPAETVLVRVQRPPSAPSSSTATPANSWNAYQQAHAGQGYSRAEMQSHYYAATRTSGGGGSATYASSGGGGSRYTTSSSSSSYGSGGGGASHSTPSNSWNAFQQAHGGQGYSRAEMQSMYRSSRR